MNNQTSSLLDTLRADPSSAFSDWLSQLDLACESEAVYLSMLSKFSSWMDRRGITFEEYGEEDIDRFLDENNLTKEHRYRYVRLIERFHIYLSTRGILKDSNPGSRAAKAGVGLGKNDLTQFLSTVEYQAVASFIAPAASREGEGKEEKKKSALSGRWSECAEWREARDKALASVMLFGALKVSEVGALSVNCIWDGGAIQVPAAGRVPEHEAWLLPEGRESVAAWVRMRNELGIPGDRLFPSNVKGDAMHAASVYRRVHRIAELAFLAAGLEVPEARLSPQTLRNTYASILFSRGFHDSDILGCMGIKEARSIKRLRDAHEIAKKQGG